MVRREGRAEEVDDLCLMAATAAGMVVEWCDQQRMLAHPLVGCFVSPIQALELEDVALQALQPYMDVFVVGPTVPLPLKNDEASELAQIHLFQHDETAA